MNKNYAPFLRAVPLFQSKNTDELASALAEDDDGPDGVTFNRPTQLRPKETTKAVA